MTEPLQWVNQLQQPSSPIKFEFQQKRSELCECSLMAGNYLLSYTNTNCGNTPEARGGYFMTYYSFNKIVLDIITEKFDIQVDENT